MKLEEKLEQLEELVRWQDSKLHGLNVPNDDKTRLVVGLIDLGLEHERAIGKLADAKYFGSVFALSRPLFEAFIRSVWLGNCATTDEIDRFKKGKNQKSIR